MEAVIAPFIADMEESVGCFCGDGDDVGDNNGDNYCDYYCDNDGGNFGGNDGNRYGDRDVDNDGVNYCGYLDDDNEGKDYIYDFVDGANGDEGCSSQISIK